MKSSEKLKLEEVYNFIYQFKSDDALRVLKEIVDSPEYSDELKEISLFKTADILFQEKQYIESKEIFIKFVKYYPRSKLNKIVQLRLKFIRNNKCES